MSKMEVSELLQNGNVLHMKLNKPRVRQVITSPQYVICGLVQLQVQSSFHVTNNYHFVVLIKLNKLYQSDHLMYSIRFSSEALNKKETFVCTDSNGNWWKVFDATSSCENVNKAQIDMDLSLEVSCVHSGFFASLHDDSQLTDFELRGKDGPVKVHKIILAGVSPFVKTLLENNGQWDEVNSNCINLPNFTQATLQQLKDYIYLQKMPEDGVKQLAELSSYFLMSDLEQRCTVKLISSLSAENAAELLEFSMKYKMKILMLVILDSIKRNVIKIEDIERAAFGNEKK